MTWSIEGGRWKVEGGKWKVEVRSTLHTVPPTATIYFHHLIPPTLLCLMLRRKNSIIYNSVIHDVIVTEYELLFL